VNRRFLSRVCGILFLVILVTQVIAPWELRRQIVSMVEENCAGCAIELDHARFTVFPLGLVLREVRLRAGDPKRTQVSVGIDEAEAALAPSWLLWRHLHFKSLKIRGVKVDILEGDLIDEPSAQASPSTWDFSIAETELSDGRLTYVREHAGRKAPIRVTAIHASLDEIGTSSELKARVSSARAQAILEATGKVSLEVASPFLSKPLHADIVLEVVEQDLAGLNPYFKTNDGVTLSGKVAKLRSEAAIDGNKLRTTVRASFDGLDIDFEKTRERAPVVAFFLNLAESVKVRSQNTQAPRAEQVKTAECVRKERESLPSFIIRGIKEAAMAIATTSSPATKANERQGKSE
jgi:hypothetical protein